MNKLLNVPAVVLFLMVCAVGITPTQEVEIKPVSYKEGVKLHNETGKPLVIQYSASWCPPCREQTRLIKQMLKSRDDFIWAYVDIDKEGPFPQITSIPFMAIKVSGEWVHVRSGYMHEEALLVSMGLTDINDELDNITESLEILATPDRFIILDLTAYENLEAQLKRIEEKLDALNKQ